MITVSGLTKQYGTRTVVDDVSFTLEPGTVTGFLGPNGAGKTTTMRMITGLVPASAGSALLDGRPYAAAPNPGAVMGTLLDAAAVHPGRTGATHLTLLASALGVPAKRVVRCSSWSASPLRADAGSAATPSACGSGWASPGRSWPTRRC